MLPKPEASTDSPQKKLRGRPKSVSPELIQEAALELFQLQGYDSTSVEEIARVAGFSRATFFNYFGTKAEIFWLETDVLLHRLAERLQQAPDSPSSITSLNRLLLDLSRDISSEDIPWIFRHSEMISSREDLLASGFSRILRLTELIEQYLQSSSVDADQVRTHSYLTVARLLGALQNWVEAGVNRKPLVHYIDALLS